MRPRSARRRAPLLAAGVAAAMAAGAVSARQDEAAAPQHFTLVPAGEGVFAAIAKEGDRASVGNAGFVIGSEAVLVVDAFAKPEAAEELMAEIRRKTPLPVKWVVNTHYHLDHVGGDAVFARAGAAIVAHENVRPWVRTENLKWRKEITPEDREMLSRLALPDITHRDGLTIWLGDRKAEVLALPGHTGGDSAVFVPSSDVYFGGDLIWKNTVPNLIDASTDQWVDTLNGILQKHGAAAFVPGHGDLARALDVRFFRDYLSGLRLSVARALSQGKSGAALVDLLLPLQKSRYGNWRWFDDFAARNIELTEAELKGEKKLPKPATP